MEPEPLDHPIAYGRPTYIVLQCSDIRVYLQYLRCHIELSAFSNVYYIPLLIHVCMYVRRKVERTILLSLRLDTLSWYYSRYDSIFLTFLFVSQLQAGCASIIIIIRPYYSRKLGKHDFKKIESNTLKILSLKPNLVYVYVRVNVYMYIPG